MSHLVCRARATMVAGFYLAEDRAEGKNERNQNQIQLECLALKRSI